MIDAVICKRRNSTKTDRAGKEKRKLFLGGLKPSISVEGDMLPKKLPITPDSAGWCAHHACLTKNCTIAAYMKL